MFPKPSSHSGSFKNVQMMPCSTSGKVHGPAKMDGSFLICNSNHEPATDGNVLPRCVSPTASETSSSSPSTCDWSFYSGGSETSSIAGKNTTQSPEMATVGPAGPSKFSIFNPGVNHLGALSVRQAHSVPYKRFIDTSRHPAVSPSNVHRSSCCDSIDCSGPLESELDTPTERVSTSEDDQDHLFEYFLHEDSVRNTNEVRPWACPSSEGRHPDAITTKDHYRLGELYTEQQATTERAGDADWHPHGVYLTQGEPSLSTECRLHNDSSFNNTFEGSAMHTYQSPAKDNEYPDVRVLDEPQLWQCHERYFTSNLCVLSKHGDGEHRTFNESLRGPKASEQPCQPAKTPFRAALINVHTASSHSLVANNTSQAKARYSAVVEERFPSSSAHGFLRFAEQDGSPCYSFFVTNSDEVLFARACKGVYTFHLKRDAGRGKGGWKGAAKRGETMSDQMGHMKVCNVHRDSYAKRSHTASSIETQFVLYEGRSQSCPKSCIENERHVGKPACGYRRAAQVDALRSELEFASLVPSCKPSHASALNIDNSMQNAMNGGQYQRAGPPYLNANESNASHLQQVELAAIVIISSSKEKKTIKKKESMDPQQGTLGWGAKFLERSSTNGWGIRFLDKGASYEKASQTTPHTEPQLQQANRVQSFEKSSKSSNGILKTDMEIIREPEKGIAHKNGKHAKQKVDVTLILPAGDHVWPMEDGDLHGPTPLLERWQSGGHCDCGGWDMGCGLSVFQSETLTISGKGAHIALTRTDRADWLSPGKPFKLFTQGHNKSKVLMLQMIEPGLLSLAFRKRFSPLQAFATAVAMFHHQVTHK